MSGSLCEAYYPRRVRDLSDGLLVISHCLREVEVLLGYDEWTGPDVDRRKLVDVQERLRAELSGFIRDHACFLVSLSSLDEAKRWKDSTERASSLTDPFDLNQMPDPARDLVAARKQAGTWLRIAAARQNRAQYVQHHIWQNRLPYAISFALGFATNVLTNLIF